jgi:tetratricopeptide (TPR) repeat protein
LIPDLIDAASIPPAVSELLQRTAAAAGAGSDTALELEAKSLLARLRVLQADYPGAESLLVELVATFAQELPRGRNTMLAVLELARLYKAWHRYEGAEAQLLRALDICSVIHGDAHLQAVNLRTELGDVMALQRRYPDAQRLFAEAVAISTELLGPGHIVTLEAAQRFAGISSHKPGGKLARLV